MVNVEIDGKKVEAQEGMMVIEAADEAGVYIPRFCYHKKLSIAANCRMCLVEIERVAKEVPACATPVTDGMKIFTRSPKAIAAQKSVMEFLLINHPLDCPICDQGGECELQDIAMGYGGDVSAFTERKRVVENKDFGPLITGDMTRCIHCTRCVRFGDEVAGIKELGATGRGEHMEIGTYIKQSLISEMSGNVIDLCPVGALTSKPFRFKARAWEIEQRETVAPHDCLGSNLQVHVFRNEVIRVVPRENEAINETWISDRDRFSYEALHTDQRLTVPMVKTDGVWEEADWGTALERVANDVKSLIDTSGAEALGALASPSSTVEELYLLQKLMRSLGSNNIDHRISQTDFTDQDNAPVYPSLGQSIEDLERLDNALLIGSNIRQDQPIAGHRLRKAAMGGTTISCINPLDYDFYFPVANNIIVAPSRIPAELAGVAKVLERNASKTLPEGLGAHFSSVEPNATHEAIAAQLTGSGKSSLLLGNDIHTHASASVIRVLATYIADVSGAALGFLSDGANAAGAHLAGALPHRDVAYRSVENPGKDVSAMLSTGLAGYILMGVEPELDFAQSAQAIKALSEAKVVVSLSTFKNDETLKYADVILPVTPFTETSGSYVNSEGRWQSFEGVVESHGDSRPAWKVLRVLGNLLDCAGFDYISSHEVRDELKAEIEKADLTDQPDNKNSISSSFSEPSEINGIELIAERSMYRGDAIQRHAASLQQADRQLLDVARINSSMATAQKLTADDKISVNNNELEITLRVIVDETVPDNCVLVASDLVGRESGSLSHNLIKISKID